MSQVKHLLTFDPGKSSGIALGTYSDTEPYRLVKVWQISGGIQGLLEWLDQHWDTERKAWKSSGEAYIDEGHFLTVVAEKFVPIPGGGFNQGLDSSLPLVGEGFSLAEDLCPHTHPQRNGGSELTHNTAKEEKTGQISGRKAGLSSKNTTCTLPVNN